MDKQSALMEKICTLGMAALFAVAMIVLGGWALFGGANSYRGPLTVIAPWIQVTVFGTGFLLLALLAVQVVASVLGVSGGHGHDHSHHHHEHDAECKHDHEHGECAHDHGQGEHVHQHEHVHDECCGHEGHDHAWSPIRYIPLVIPLLLCVMGLPNALMIQGYEQDLMGDVGAGAAAFAAAPMPGEPCRKAAQAGTAAGAFPVGLALAEVFAALADGTDEDPNATPRRTDLAELERISNSPFDREQWAKYRSVEVEGMFNPGQPTENGFQVFSVVQLRVACCLGDAKPAVMLGVARKVPPGLTSRDWVAARGRLEFIKTQEGVKPAMRVFRVEKKTMPARPYLTR